MPKILEVKERRSSLINVKVNAEEHKTMVKNAKKYTKGNLSKWIRLSSIKLVPKKADLA